MKLSDLPIKYQKQAKAQTGGMNEMEMEFYAKWRRLGGPELVSQHKPFSNRRYAIDFAHLETKVAIELEGGIWLKTDDGRGKGHANPKRFISDCEKYNRLTADGWHVFRLATGMTTPKNMQPIIDFIEIAKMREKTLDILYYP